MKILDDGHQYNLQILDGDSTQSQQLTFVKRTGDKYPGNQTAYPGTTSQDVIRCLIDRNIYTDRQLPCWHNKLIKQLLICALYLLELRHWQKHNLKILPLKNIHQAPTCEACGHTNCHCK